MMIDLMRLPGVIAVRACLCAGVSLVLGCASREAPEPRETIALTELTVFEPNESLHNVRDLTVGPDQEVYVAAGSAPHVHRYAGDGRLLGTFGRSGRGPGEFIYPEGVFVTENQVRIWDQGRQQLVDYSRSGEYSGRYQALNTGSGIVLAGLEATSYARGRIGRSWNGGYLVQEPRDRITNVRDVTEALLLVIDSTGAVRDTLADFQAMSRDMGHILGVARDLIPIPLWTTCASGSAVVLDPYRRAVRRFANGIESYVGESLDLPVDEISDEDVRRWLRNSLEQQFREQNRALSEDDVRRLIERVVSEGRDMFGTVAPPAVSLLCDPRDRLWLQRFSTEDDVRGFGREWLVLEGGKHVRSFRFPAGFQPLLIGEEAVLGVFRDELDVETPAKVRLAP